MKWVISKIVVGGGYAGGYMYDKNSTNNDDREYIYTKLVDTLKAGHKYLASMYVNKTNGWDYAIATIGMLFTDTAIVLPWAQGFIQATPQVKHTTLISDTAHWTLIQDTITAVGNEVYLTIGNFNTNATCGAVHTGGNGSFSGAAYYYIDGVSVYDVGMAGVEQLAVNNKQVTVYPNPATSNLQVTLASNSKIQEINLYDVLGKEIPIPNPFLWKGLGIGIDVSNLQNGVYFINIKTNGKAYNTKFIKE